MTEAPAHTGIRPAEAAWRRRYRAASIGLPNWARDKPERAVYGSNASGRWEVYAWDVAAGTHRRVTDRAEGTTGAAIEPSGEAIWWFDDSKGNEHGRWMRVPWDAVAAASEDVDPGASAPAAPGVPDAYRAGIAIGTAFVVIGTSDRGTHEIWTSRADGAAQVLYKSDTAAGVAALNRDETLLAITHAEHTGDSRNRAARIVDLDGAPVDEIWDGPGKGVSPGSWSRVPGDDRLLLSHERGGSRRPAVWSPRTGRLEDLDIDMDGEIGASWYPDAAALLLTRLARGRTELYRYDLATRAVERIDIEDGMVSGARVRPDGELWYAITTASRPAEVRRRRPRAPGETLLRPDGERAPEGVSYVDVQVGEVHALLAEPATGSRPRPLVLQIHGGPAGMDAHAFSAGVQAWVDHGFAVAMVNYRGSSGYGKAWRDAIVGRPGFMETEDIVAVRDHLVAEGIADPAAIVLTGGSWGGYLTLFGVGTRPDAFTAGISGVPLADLHAHYHEQAEPLRVYAHALFGGSPESAPATFRDCSPLTYAEQVRVPLFILAGENDPRCPIGQVNNYVKRMADLGSDVEVYRYDAGHGSLVVDEQISQMVLRLRFLAGRLGTPPPL